MALTTRALVLQRIGATDDATSEGAILITNISGTSGTYVYGSTANRLTLGWASGAQSGYFDCSAAANDTLSELAAAITAGTVTGGNSTSGHFTASVVPGAGNSTASTLLDVVSVTAIATGTSAILTYSNTAAGTVAALIDVLIDEVSAAIERYCDRSFATASRDERYSGNDGEALVLKSAPVTAVSQVSYFDNEGTETVLDSGAYRVDSGSGVLYMLGSGLAFSPNGYVGSATSYSGSYGISYDASGPARFRVNAPSWWYGFNNWRVQYTGGYSSTPADIQGVATEMVVTLYMDRRQSRRAASRSVGGDNVSYRTPEELVRYYDATLSQYRRVVL